MSDTIITDSQGNDLTGKQPTVAEILASKNTKLDSSVPFEQMSEAAKKARYQLLRSKMGQSRLTVIGLPGLHYCWASKDDLNELARLDSLGYEIVREPEAEAVLAGKKQPKIQANGLKADGTYTVGDVILVQCSEEVYEFIQMANSERYEEMALGAQRDFRLEAEKLAVPTFEHSK
jgi:hypothetical protein